MSDFVEVRKHLDISTSRKAALEEVRNANYPVDKYYSIQHSRAINKIITTLTIPKLESSGAILGIPIPSIVAQYNCLAPQVFYITNHERDLKYLDTIQDNALCVRFQKDGSVYRYVLTGSLGHFPLYDNHLIQPRFVFEIWSTKVGNAPGFDKDIIIETSLIQNPTTVDTLRVDFPQEILVSDYTKYFKALPQDLPFNFDPDIVWGDN